MTQVQKITFLCFAACLLPLSPTAGAENQPQLTEANFPCYVFSVGAKIKGKQNPRFTKCAAQHDLTYKEIEDADKGDEITSFDAPFFSYKRTKSIPNVSSDDMDEVDSNDVFQPDTPFSQYQTQVRDKEDDQGIILETISFKGAAQAEGIDWFWFKNEAQGVFTLTPSQVKQILDPSSSSDDSSERSEIEFSPTPPIQQQDSSSKSGWLDAGIIGVGLCALLILIVKRQQTSPYRQASPRTQKKTPSPTLTLRK